MGEELRDSKLEVLVSFKVVVVIAEHDTECTISDFFEHEIRHALTPSVELAAAMFEQVGLPLQALEIGPI